MKTWLSQNWWWLIIVAALYWAGVNYGALQAEKEISTIKAEKAEAINKTIEHERTIVGLNKKVDGLEVELTVLDDALGAATQKEQAALVRVAKLEDEKGATKLTVQMIRKEEDTLDEFVKAFPALTHATNFGMLDVESDGLIIPYITFPFFFIDAFIVNKNELDTANQQLNEYGGITEIRATIDQLNDDKAGLLRKVAMLESQKFTACEGVRKDMTRTLIERQDKHIATLSKPSFDWSNKMAFGAGVLLCGTGAYFLSEF
jgi:hypothetical protein